MNNFDLNKVWVELKMSYFYFVEIMNVVFGKEKFVIEIKCEF